MKTTITAAFASLAENAVLADCDVDAADLHLILNPDIQNTIDFFGLKLAKKDADKPKDKKKDSKKDTKKGDNQSSSKSSSVASTAKKSSSNAST